MSSEREIAFSKYWEGKEGRKLTINVVKYAYFAGWSDRPYFPTKANDTEPPVAWRWRDREGDAWNIVDFDPVQLDYRFVEPLYVGAPPPAETMSEASDV